MDHLENQYKNDFNQSSNCDEKLTDWNLNANYEEADDEDIDMDEDIDEDLFELNRKLEVAYGSVYRIEKEEDVSLLFFPTLTTYN